MKKQTKITTVQMARDIHCAAKHAATVEGTSVKDFVEAAVHHYISERHPEVLEFSPLDED